MAQNALPYVRKTAEALALRKAFPNDLSGIYVDSEMERTGAVVDASEVTPKKPELFTGTVSPEAPIVTGPVVSPLQNLFADARGFGAKEGEEGVFIQEQLSKDIAWEMLKDKDVALLRTELKSKLTPR